MDISVVIAYLFLGLFMIIGYFLKDKVDSLESNIDAAFKKQETYERDNNAFHAKILEFYVTKIEYENSINRVFAILETISNDIKHLMSSKADKS